jgi:hypothetical protein
VPLSIGRAACLAKASIPLAAKPLIEGSRVREVPIKQIHYDGANGVRIVPALVDERVDNYDAVHRAANGVRWDADGAALIMTPRADGSQRTPLEAFQQISAAVASEYGQRLIITPNTTFHYLTPEDRSTIYVWTGAAGGARR